MAATLVDIDFDRVVGGAVQDPALDRLNMRPLLDEPESPDGYRLEYDTRPRSGLFGDLIGRATLLRAERTGRVAFGMELGALGTLTLRAIIPWRDGDRIIGYVELGHDVEHFLEEINQILSVELVVLIYKKFVNRDGWLAGTETRERRWNWDEFETMVSVARTMQEIPHALRPYFEEDHHPYQLFLPLAEDGHDADSLIREMLSQWPESADKEEP